MSEITNEDEVPEAVVEDAGAAEATEAAESEEIPANTEVAETTEAAKAAESTETAKATKATKAAETAEAEVTETAAPEPEPAPESDPELTPEPLVAPEPTPLTAPTPLAAPTPLPYPTPVLESPPSSPSLPPPSSPSPPPSLPLPPKPRRKFPFPWRWVGAVVTMLAVGTGCAFAVMAPQRTELPGLKTASDGRYDFAPLVLPTLAPGQSDPGVFANPGAQHISDIRKLLLVPPKGAVLDHSLPGDTGWVSKAATLALIGNSSSAADQLATDGWRHTAGIAWKTPDGAETKILLVQFIDSTAATDASAIFDTFNGGDSQDTSANLPLADSNSAEYFHVVKGSTATWYGQTTAYDTELLIEFTAPTSVGITPFEQEIDLQTEMLQ